MSLNLSCQHQNVEYAETLKETLMQTLKFLLKIFKKNLKLR
jgi:hypothetical protein